MRIKEKDEACCVRHGQTHAGALEGKCARGALNRLDLMHMNLLPLRGDLKSGRCLGMLGDGMSFLENSEKKEPKKIKRT